MAEIDSAATPPDAPSSGNTGKRPSRGPLFKLGALVLLVVAGYLVATRTPLSGYLTREGIFEVVEWLRGHPWAPAIFVAIYASATALAVPGTILTLGGGAIFGFWWGTLLNMIAANIGANAAFAIARALGRDGVRHLVGSDSTALDKLDNVVKRHGFQGLLTLRLIPLVPFNALNFGSGLMPLRWRTYSLATLIGIIPGTAVYTFFADSLLQGSQEASREALVRVAIAGALLVLLSFLPALLKRLNIRLPGMMPRLNLTGGSWLAMPSGVVPSRDPAGPRNDRSRSESANASTISLPWLGGLSITTRPSCGSDRSER